MHLQDFINPQEPARTVVAGSVCVSIIQPRMFVRLPNDTTYLAGSEGQICVGVGFVAKIEIWHCTAMCIVHFYSAETTHVCYY